MTSTSSPAEPGAGNGEAPDDEETAPSSITGFTDPDGEAPWAMQFVVRVEKTTPPRHSDVIEACARATVLLLDEVQRCGNEQARRRVERWLDGRIRKVVRRGRGASWTAAAQFSEAGEGRRVAHGSAEVAVYLPGPTDQVAPMLRKLQVAGLELDDDHGVPAEVMPPQDVRILLNPDLALSTGKAAAQAAHAAQVLWMRLESSARDAWLDRGAPLTVLTATPEGWAAVADDAPVQIRDAGFTEIPAGSQTCVALTQLPLDPDLVVV